MTERSDAEQGRDERIAAILGGYFEDAEAGVAPEREGLLGRHPELAGELAAFFDQQERFDDLLAPLREAARVARREEPTERDPEGAMPSTPDARTWAEDEACP